jgi:polysaccharide biosynthesis transport protein
MESSLTAKYELLRTRLESDLPFPAVILVTSALAGDGKSLTAHGLADSLSQVGRRVALVDGAPATDSSMLSPSPNADREYPLIPFPFESLDARAFTSSVQTFVQELRTKFEFTIIDGAPFTSSNISVVMAGAVDGVLLTVRLGRAQSEDDVLMCRTLEHTKANVLGVVAVSGDPISAFNAFRSPRDPSRKRRFSPEPIDGNVLTVSSVVR